MTRPSRAGVWLAACLLTIGCGGGEVARLIADLSSDQTSIRRTAAQELGTLKSTDLRVVTALQAATDDADRDVRRLACFALGETGSGTSELTAALDDAELSVRMAAAFGLLKIEPENDAAISVLTRTMKRGDGGVIVAVTKEGPRAQWAVPTLIDLLNDQRPGIRRLAADGLGQIGLASPEVISALERAARDRDDRVRESVAAAIDKIHGV